MAADEVLTTAQFAEEVRMCLEAEGVETPEVINNHKDRLVVVKFRLGESEVQKGWIKPFFTKEQTLQEVLDIISRC